MSKSTDFSQIPTTIHSSTRPPGDSLWPSPVSAADPRVPLLNLSTVRSRMDSLHRFLSESVNNNSLIGKDQMDMVSTEISSAIHQIIVNGAALLACTQLPSPHTEQKTNPTNNTPTTTSTTDLKFPDTDDLKISDPNDLKISDPNDLKISETDDKKFSDHLTVVETTNMKVEEEEEIQIPSDDWEIIELDSVELLAEHIHFCDICGKGFKRDANLRMHMRAHGNQFKTPEALAKPERVSLAESSRRLTRFSCPFVGCNRNKSHKKFRPLKSAICVKNHFKRSHCPKMYSCNRCNKKSFSVLADLKSHLKHCGESKWKCSCGTTFSRKDKLFGHMALFEGHMPAVEATAAAAVVLLEDEEEDEDRIRDGEIGENSGDNGFFDGFLDGFGSIEEYCLQDVLGSPNGFYNF